MVKLLETFMEDSFAGYTHEEVDIIAQAKRLRERFRGDREFREALLNQQANRNDLLARIGITMDASELAPVWDQLENNNSTSNETVDLSSYPVFQLWRGWRELYGKSVRSWYGDETQLSNLRTAKWRRRMINLNIGQVGRLRKQNIYPLFAYELSQGCSMGCWFCGFDPPPFGGYFPFSEENAELWWEILVVGYEIFGSAAAWASCYHATEPFDNPDYLSFLQVFHNCYSVLPQTTTAKPLHDIARTREILAFRDRFPLYPDRFSVLSDEMLRKIHTAFTPYELRHVELVLQNNGALTQKCVCGRSGRNKERLRSAIPDDFERHEQQIFHNVQSIECICGYVVNMVERSIKMISPCQATTEWPNGYRVHAEATFRDAAEYRSILHWTIDKFMPTEPEWAEPLSFRPDLAYERQEDGFSVATGSYRHSLKGTHWYGLLGDLIHQGDVSAGEIILQLAADGIPIADVQATVQRIFDSGLLEQ